jgi:hypothetical protein
MRAQTIGRVLGIGLRVAGRVANQRMASNSQSAPAPERAPQVIDAAARGRSAAQTAQRVGRATKQGAGGFFRSFRRAGGIVWLQVTGTFFLLFVLLAAGTLWKTRPVHLQGPYDRNFLASAIVLVVFSYLSLSSFWRAGRK